MKASLNKTAFNGCRISNVSTRGNYLYLEGLSFPTNDFSLDCWFYVDGISNKIISQEDGFYFGLEDGKIVFYYPELGKKVFSSPLKNIVPNQWNNVLITYGATAGVLTVYLNGLPIGSLTTTKIKINNKRLYIGEELTGYIRSARFYSCVIAEEDFKKYMYQAVYTEEMSDLLAFVDCSSGGIKDLSPNKNKVFAMGNCAPMNLVHGYTPSEGSYAYVRNDKATNPGGFSTGEFAVYAKVYVEHSDSVQAIWSNGTIDDEDGVALFVNPRTDDAGELSLQLGENKYSLCSDMIYGDWLDIIINVSQSKISCFISGNKISETNISGFTRTSKADFRIGNYLGDSRSDYAFAGLISMVAVFKKVLSEADAVAFAENHPFIFEENMISLFSFDTGTAVELVSSTDVFTLSTDMKIGQRTMKSIPTDGYVYRINRTFSEKPKMRTWKAGVVGESLLGYYGAAYNLSPCATVEQQNAALSSIAEDIELLDDCNSVYTQDVIEADDTTQLLDNLSPSKTVKLNKMYSLNTTANAGLSLNLGAAICATGAAINFNNKTFKYLAAAAMVVLVTGAIGTIVLDKINDKPDYDDDDDGELKLSLLALTFQHNPDDLSTSAIRCQTVEGIYTGPEWTSTDKTSAKAVYVAEKISSVKVKAKIRITDTRKKPATKPISVKLSAFSLSEKSSFFNHLEYSGSLAVNSDHEVILTAKEKAMSVNAVSKGEMNLSWNYELDGRKNTTVNTKCTVYILPKVPAFPIVTDSTDSTDSEKLLYLEFLEFVAKAGESVDDGGERADTLTAADLTNSTNMIYEHPKLIYSPVGVGDFITAKKEVIEGVSVKTIILDVKKMMKALNGSTREAVNIECTVFASILAYFFLASGVEGVDIEVIQTPYLEMSGSFFGTLKTNRIIPAKCLPVEEEFDYHVITKVPGGTFDGIDYDMYYDASCRLDDGSESGRTLANLRYSNDNGPMVVAEDVNTYRGLFFKPRTFAIISSMPYAKFRFCVQFKQ